MLYLNLEYFERDEGSYIDVSPTIRNDENIAMKSWRSTASRIVRSLNNPRNSFFTMMERWRNFT